MIIKPIITDDLALYLPFNEVTGTTVYDYSGNANNGTATGTTIVKTNYNGEKSRNFSGTGDYINLYANPIPVGTWSSFTISFWIYQSSLGYGHIYHQNLSGTELQNSPYIVVQDTNGTIRFHSWTGTLTNVYYFDSTDKIIVNQWNHVVCIWDGSTQTVEIIINGNSSTPVRNTGAAGYANSGILIGANTSLTQLINCKLSEFKIWNRILTTEEINADHNNTYRV